MRRALTSILFTSAIILHAQVPSVTIGKQVWMTKNLDVATFKNGDPIPQAKTDEEWQKAGENRQPAWCYYNNDPANGAKYGKLYNGYAVADARGLCPIGWHVPSDGEWSVLTNSLGGEKVAGDKMKSKNGWRDNGKGNNTSGFNGLASGDRDPDGAFSNVGEAGYWRGSTVVGTQDGWGRSLGWLGEEVGRFNLDKAYGFSVRCVKD